VIEEINGRRISDWTKALTLIAVNPDTDVAVTLDRNGEKKVLALRPEAVSELRIGSSGSCRTCLLRSAGSGPDFPRKRPASG